MTAPIITATPAARLTAGDRAEINRLFHANYRDADSSYLDKSARIFGTLAFARDPDSDAMVGFSFGDSRRTTLPGFDAPQAVAMAGIACVDPDARRQGLFTQLATAAMQAGGALDRAKPSLFTGRMAHAITYRATAKMSPSTVVPSGERPINDLHREVGIAVARLFGATLDPDTFVVQGSGTPVGFPRVAYETSPGEEKLFAKVDRQRGDSLLAMCWIPSAPAGW